MKNHIPTLETCQKLKKLGFPQQKGMNGIFYWIRSKAGGYHPRTSDFIDEREGTSAVAEIICYAPITTELLEWGQDYASFIYQDGIWWVHSNSYTAKDCNFAEALAQTLIYLVENKKASFNKEESFIVNEVENK